MTGKTPVRDRHVPSAGLRIVYRPSDLASGRSILRVGEVPRVEAHSVERKLAAIFAADVEGYRRLMGQDEVGTLRTLTAYRVITDRLIAARRGRIFTTAGDRLVADFASAVDAVECAVLPRHVVDLEEREDKMAIDIR
jgi:class 3 adenylate cyclase